MNFCDLDAPPQTVETAVNRLIDELSFEERTRLLNPSPDKTTDLLSCLTSVIRDEFQLMRNRRLIDSCCTRIGKKWVTPEEATGLILAVLRERLPFSGALRVVRNLRKPQPVLRIVQVRLIRDALGGLIMNELNAFQLKELLGRV
jgi:hypothetical protein